MKTAFHGIGAYSGQRNPLALRNALSVCINTDAQICVADRPIGAMGAVFFGEIAVVFEQDVWSYVENGKRYADDYIDAEFIANPKNQEGFENFCREHKKNERSYCEAWMQVDALRAIWVKEWADDA